MLWLDLREYTALEYAVLILKEDLHLTYYEIANRLKMKPIEIIDIYEKLKEQESK
jgi:hypothetical protein